MHAKNPALTIIECQPSNGNDRVVLVILLIRMTSLTWPKTLLNSAHIMLWYSCYHECTAMSSWVVTLANLMYIINLNLRERERKRNQIIISSLLRAIFLYKLYKNWYSPSASMLGVQFTLLCFICNNVCLHSTCTPVRLCTCFTCRYACDCDVTWKRSITAQL